MAPLDAFCHGPSMVGPIRSASNSSLPTPPPSNSPSKSSVERSFARARADNAVINKLPLCKVVALWRDLRSQGVPAGSETKLMRRLSARLRGSKIYFPIAYE
jgi:hypothetical protein